MNSGDQPMFAAATCGDWQIGRTYRQWLAAHAPHEPAFWFKPKMPPKPESAWRDSSGNLYVDGISEVYRNGVIEQLHDANQEAVEAWERQRRIAFTAQWPWAWADAVLAAENGGGV